MPTFNAKNVMRRLSVRISDRVESVMERRVQRVVEAIRAEQKQIFRYIALDVLGKTAPPGPVASRAFWPPLSASWMQRKRRNKNRFFLHEGILRRNLRGYDPMALLGEPRISRGRDQRGRFISDRQVYTISLFPRINNNQFSGAERLLNADDQAKLLGRRSSFRPVMQPVLQHFATFRIRRAVRRALGGGDTLR